MLRQVREMLSKRSHRRFETSSSPSWSNLPVEMKWEVTKHLGFTDRLRLRSCSKKDQSLVDSLPCTIPIVQLSIENSTFTIIIVNSSTDILRVDISEKRILLRNRTRIVKSYEFDVGLDKHYTKLEIGAVLNGFFATLSRKNVKIKTLNIYMDLQNIILSSCSFTTWRVAEKIAKCHQIMRQHGHTPRVIFSCSEYFFTVPEFLRVDEVKVFWVVAVNTTGVERKMYSGIRKVKYGIPTETICSRDMEYYGDVERLIIRLLRAELINPIGETFDFHAMPGMDNPDLSAVCQQFQGRMEKLSNVTFLWFPPLDTYSVGVLVKISECGVLIEVIRTIHKPEYDIEDTCMFKWLCSKCDKSLESWYFRKALNMD